MKWSYTNSFGDTLKHTFQLALLVRLAFLQQEVLFAKLNGKIYEFQQNEWIFLLCLHNLCDIFKLSVHLNLCSLLNFSLLGTLVVNKQKQGDALKPSNYSRASAAASYSLQAKRV